MQSLKGKRFRLKDGVRVRTEVFGLLFYCRDGPKLTFLYSGSWIRPEFFSQRFTLREWLLRENLKGSEEELTGLEVKIARALLRLVGKGLIDETVEHTCGANNPGQCNLGNYTPV